MKIGLTFGTELQAAGLGNGISWDCESGEIQFDASLTPTQINAVKAVYATHDPLKPTPARPKALTLDSLAAALQAKGTLTDVEIEAAKK